MLHTVRARGEAGEKVDFSRQCNSLVNTHKVSERFSAFKKSQGPRFASSPASHLTLSFLLLLFTGLQGKFLGTAPERVSVDQRLLSVEGARPGGILLVVFLAPQLLSSALQAP